MVDVEADGPIPGDFSMIALGAIVVDPRLDRTFRALIRPISDRWVSSALAVSGYSREQTLEFEDAAIVMARFRDWIGAVNRDRPMFVSDNAGFDWQFVNWYFHHFLGENPFGHSSTHLGSLYKGMVKDAFQSFKHLRQTPHTHDPLDDARGNAEALLAMKQELGLRIKLG
jgi:hypothetical protein